jgi:hypothetical protein
MSSCAVKNWCEEVSVTPLHLLALSSGTFIELFPAPIGYSTAKLWFVVGIIPALLLTAVISLALAPIMIFANIFGR